MERRLSSKRIYEGRILSLRVDEVEVSRNGRHAHREVVEHGSAVAILARDDQGRLLFVKQFRYPHGAVTTEIPAGKLEKGEDIAECGRRELLEEIGCTCEEYTYLGAVLPTPAYDTEVIHIYMAQGLKKAQQHLDEGEFLDVEKVPLTEAVEMVMDGRITDAKTQIGLLKAARLLEK